MEIEKKRRITYLCFSMLFGIACAMGCSIYKNGRIGLSLFDLMWGFVGCRIFLELITLLSKMVVRNSSAALSINPKKLWIILFFSMIISYSICLLVYFPGVGMNDSLNILSSGMSTSQQFPVFYVAAITILRNIGWRLFGNYQVAIAAYSIIQIFIVSAISASMLTWLFQKELPVSMMILISLYYICSPLLSMYAISMVKDTVFSLLLTVLCVNLYEIAETKGQLLAKKRTVVVFVLTCIGVIFTRNNGSFIVIPLLFILLMIYRHFWKQLMIVFGTVVAGIVLSSAATNHYSSGQLFQEAVAIPIQQLSACVKEDGELTESQLDFIDHIMPLEAIKEQYDPYSADAIKWSASFNRNYLQQNKVPFLKVWIKAMPHNLKIYTLAWLQQTYWFWAPRQTGYVQAFFTIENFSDNTWLLDFTKKYGIHDSPLLPEGLNHYLRDYYTHATIFFREGVCFWLTLALVVVIRFKNNGKQFYLAFLPIFLLWLTLMASTPVASSFRYVFVYAYALPIFLGLLFTKQNKEKNTIPNETR